MEWVRIICALVGIALMLIGYAHSIVILLILGIALAIIGGLAFLIIDFNILDRLSHRN